MLARNSCLNEKWVYECDASVISIAATPNCSLISATTVGRSLYLLNSEGNLLWKKSGEPEGLDHEGWSTAISSDGSAIAVGTANKNPVDGSIYIFNTNGDQVFLDIVEAPVWSLSLSSNGDILVASCWDGKAYKYARDGSSYNRVAVLDLKTREGLYGIKINRSGTQTYVCSYDSAVVILDEKWSVIESYSNKDGAYNIAIAEGISSGFIGLREGEILKLQFDTRDSKKLKVNECSRPVCGVACSNDGKVLIGGSFDGWVYLLKEDGAILERLETNGEVWSIACSDDAARICIASGDKTIRFVENRCNAASIFETAEFESSCLQSKDIEKALQKLIETYTHLGLYEYGYTHLKSLQSSFNGRGSMIFEKKRIELLTSAINYATHSHWAHFELGLYAKYKNRQRDAISHFQFAANNPRFAVKSMIQCAESFKAKKLSTATASCYRRARGQQLDNDAKRAIYSLGRSYEDNRNWHGAFSHYQLLASWDINYRNVWERLERLIDISKYSQAEVIPPRTDYTGLTASSLGHGLLQDVGESLRGVLKARSSEVLVAPYERQRVSEIINTLRSNERFCRGITGTGLDYDQELFLKYDYALPEDETKKFLETVNFFYLLNDFSLANKITLDIGSATGRYPMLMKWMGAQAYGIDIEPRAVEYAQKQIPPDVEFPKFFCADASQDFPEPIPKVNLVTCMMGTIAHIPQMRQQIVLNKIYDCLLPEGYVAISTWDCECSHLSYLSIYNEIQKDTIRQNAPSSDKMREMLEQAGFQHIQIRPFCLLPQVVVYDLGIENLRSGDIELAAQADLAVRALYPYRHGEMFIAFGVKPQVKSILNFGENWT